MQQSIIEYLKNKYKPSAIILHGSRARGMEREHSDWDFVFLYTKLAQGCNGREVYENQHIEFSSHVLPIFDIEGEFAGKLQGAKVVYEESSAGTTLLEQAHLYYQQGVYWSREKVCDHALWVQGRIDGMSASIDSPVVFHKYFSDFYQRIFNYWYWLIEHRHSQPIYVAVKEVADKDPKYYELVNRFANAGTSFDEKVELAKKIKGRLFPEKY